MRSPLRIAAPLMALALVAQAVPAYAYAPIAGGAGATTLSAAAQPPAGSAGDRNLDEWIDQVEANPNKFDQDLEEECIQTGGPACALDYAQIQRIPGEIESLTKTLVENVTRDKALETEVTTDLSASPEQTRSLGSAAKGILSIIKTVPKNKAIQTLAGRSDKIGMITDNVSRLGVASLEGQSTLAGEKHYLVAASKTIIYSMPIFGDVFSLGEAILDPSLTTAQRVETGVVASLSLIATAAAFAGGPVGVAAATVIGIGVAAYYAIKAVWGWLAGGSTDWASMPPTTPEELFQKGAYIQWDARTDTSGAAKRPVAMTVPLTGQGQSSTVSQTLLLDSRWNDYNKEGKPVTYKFEPYTGARNVPQGLYERSKWGATSASLTVWQNGAKTTKGCNVSGVKSYFNPTYYFFNCGPASTIEISLDHPAVVTLTYTYSMDSSPCGQVPCALSSSQVNASSSLSVYSTADDKITIPLPFSFAVVAKSAASAETQS